MRHTAYAWFALLILFLGTSCPQAEQGDATAIGTASPGDSEAGATEVQAQATPRAPTGASFVWLTTEDGFQVAAWYWPQGQDGSASAPGVICLHMRGHDKSTFEGIAPKLVAEGYAVVAIDFRGHGDTRDPQGRSIALDSLNDADYQAMLNDIAAAHNYLDEQKHVDGERVGIIGASIGANLAIMYAAGDHRVRTVVALSPGLDYKGLKPLDALPGFGTRALYIAVAREDKYAYSSSAEIKRVAVQADPVSFREFDGKEHGTDLFAAHPGFDDTIVSGWFLNHLPPER